MRKSNYKRPLRDEDYLSFFDVVDHRSGPMTRDQIIAKLEKKNSFRMWRIRHDYKWLKKQMKKMGQNPDDARELL